MAASLTQDEIAALLDVVDRFASHSVDPLVARHEIPLTPPQLEQLTGEAQALGLLSLGAAPGAGLWENPADAATVEFSMRALVRLAESNAGVAWHFSQLALGRRVALQLGLDPLLAQGHALASVQGFYGLGRTALPRYLVGTALVNDDRAMLAAYFTPPGDADRCILHAAEGWHTLLAPCFANDRIAWRVLPRERLACEPQPHTHGLDEIGCVAWRPGPEAGDLARLDAGRSREVYAEALQVEALALMSIALGAVRHAYEIASGYAAVRWQGGTTIDRLPAVQQMLAGMRAAINMGMALVSYLAGRPLALARTAEILSARSYASPMFSRAATDAVQAMGGIGYMQDTGVEKILRDVNQLRLMSGTPGELHLFVAEWERVR